MTTTDTSVQTLVINQLSKADYDAITTPSATELYLVEENIAQIYPVIETYQSGDSWYILYSNNFCIQGSLYYKGSTIAGNNTITFLKAFANTNYTLLPIPIHSAANLSSYAINEKYVNRTTSQATIYSGSAAFGYSWVAFGYVS